VIRVLVVDDHAVVREGLRAALSTRDDLEIVGESASGNDAVDLAAALEPDVVIMDLGLPDIDGATATRRILSAGLRTRVVVLTMAADDDSVLRAIRAGAHGYVLKDAERDEIERAVRTVAAGGTLLTGAAGDVVVGALRGGRRATLTPFPQLSEREQETLELLAQGRSNGEIARALFLSPKTVRNRMSTIFTKLGVDDRSQAIIAARDAGLGRT